MGGYILPKGYLSASSISTMLKCPMQFYYRYVQDIVIPPGAALVTGSVAHKSFEQYYNLVIQANDRLTEEQAGEMAAAEFDAYISGSEVAMTQQEKDKAKPDVVVSKYVKHIASGVTPIACEEQFKVAMPCGVDILGFVDLKHRLSDGGTGIIDYKITNKAWSIGTLRNSIQFMLYSMLTGLHDVQVHNITKTKYKPFADESPEVDGVRKVASNMQVLHHNFDASILRHLDTLVESVATSISSGIFIPCDPSSWCCTPEWCGYWNLCRGRG